VSGPVTVRNAVASDLAAMLQVDDRARCGNVERTTYLGESLRLAHCLLACAARVGDDQREIVGVAVLRHGHFFARDFVDYLFVHAEHRRVGIGSDLLRASVSAATSARVFTSTNESNGPMQALLRTGGWTFSGRLQGLDQGDPELVYFLDPGAR
jgi:ribosomal protein S18 acetylase RimI-like enzyme